MIKNCRNLTIHKFNEIVLDISNIHLLNEEGENASEEDLLDAWYSILDEYNELLNNRTSKLEIRKKAELYYLEIKVRNYSIIHDLLDIADFDRIVSICESYRIKPDKKAIESSIHAINNKINKLSIELSEKKDSGQTLEDAKAAIEQSRGINIDKYTTSLSEWAAYINQHNKKVKESGKVQNRRGKRSRNRVG